MKPATYFLRLCVINIHKFWSAKAEKVIFVIHCYSRKSGRDAKKLNRCPELIGRLHRINVFR